MHDSIKYWMAATLLRGVSALTIHKWLEFYSIEALFQMDKATLKAQGFSAKQIAILQQTNWQAVEKELAWINESQHIITLADERYPARLKEIPDAPLLLYVRGNVAMLNALQLAIVGARGATPAGMQHAHAFAGHLAAKGLVITSGLAAGIDGAAHRGALARHGITIAVAGTGLLHCYPRAHSRLAEEILQQGGAIISEFPLATPPVPTNFPRRNRIISGLCIGVLVVEAAIKSGSLVTARMALEQGREVFAIPSAISNPMAKGCHHLIRQGATLVEKAEDILEECGDIFSIFSEDCIPNKPDEKRVPLALQEEAILQQIDYEITPIDVIVLRSRLTASDVSSILLTLELNGYVASLPGGFIRL